MSDNQQRIDKTRQDQMPASERPRVEAARRRLEWMKENRPTCSSDWAAFNYKEAKRNAE